MGLRSGIERMERRLLRIFGPAELADRDERPAPSTGVSTCPACGRPMAEHQVDRSGNHNRVTCPTV